MKAKQLCLASLLLLPLGVAGAWSQEKKAAPAGAPSDDPMMAKMMEFGTPGAAHKVLDMKVGKWTVKGKMMTPGQPATEFTGTGETKWIMDGRFLQDTVTGDFMGMQMQGIGTTGYDNMKKKYVSSWIDNMGTGIYYAEGTYDAATKTFTHMGESPDVMAGKYVKCRSVEKWTDNDHWTAQSYKTGADGKEFVEMEMQGTRVK